MKTSNLFIAQQCDQAGEITELDQCIASGQVSAAQVEAHRVAGDFVQTTPVTNANIDAAREALDSLDDFARMTVGVNAIGPRSVLERFIANVAAIAQPVQSSQALQTIARLLQVHEGRNPEDALKIAAGMIGAQPVQPAAVGAVLAPHYRGYANLGSGQYVLNHTADLPAELIISIATEEEKAGRAVGDSRGLEPKAILHPEDMAVRLRFENVAGLDALEQQLRFLREELFPESIVGTK